MSFQVRLPGHLEWPHLRKCSRGRRRHSFCAIILRFIIMITRAGPVLGVERARPGGCLNTFPPNSAPVMQGHAVSGIRKSVKNHDETASVIFWIRWKVRSPEVTKGQILSFSTFFFYKSAHNSRTRGATALRKSACDSSFNFFFA